MKLLLPSCVALGAVALALSAAQAQTAASAPAVTPTPTAPAVTPTAPVAAPALPAPTTMPAPAAPAVAAADATQGKVAHYGAKFNGRKTASGEVFNSNAMTMAHKTLPFGTRVKVTNVANGKSVVVRVNDRGPSTPDRVGDLTTGAARKIGMTKAGVVEAKLEVVGSGAKKK
jgi:rare lipoprotein A